MPPQTSAIAAARSRDRTCGDTRTGQRAIMKRAR